MNRLTAERQALILELLSEGCSIRSVERITGHHRDTIMRLSHRMGLKAMKFMEEKQRNIDAQIVEVDELWAYAGCKQHRLTEAERRSKNSSRGDQFVFLSMDQGSRFIINFHVGKRTLRNTKEFIEEMASRIKATPEIYSDDFPAYATAIDLAYGGKVNYATLVKDIRKGFWDPKKRDSWAKFVEARPKKIWGDPDMGSVSTSRIERLNLSMRHISKRIARATLAFSKKLEHLISGIALSVFSYNYVRGHKKHRGGTPAMATGTAESFLKWSDLIEWRSN